MSELPTYYKDLYLLVTNLSFLPVSTLPLKGSQPFYSILVFTFFIFHVVHDLRDLHLRLMTSSGNLS